MYAVVLAGKIASYPQGGIQLSLDVEEVRFDLFGPSPGFLFLDLPAREVLFVHIIDASEFGSLHMQCLR